MEWIVFDYGGVISLAPPDEAGALLPRTLGVSADRFWPVYWSNRELYDQGVLTAEGYWQAVCGRLGAPAADTDLVELLVTLDVRAWSHVNGETVGLLRELAAANTPLALLSNAPLEMARAVDGRPWAGLFRHRLYSADLGLVKPDPAIYRRLTERLEADPGQVVFVDDREDNVRAAEAAGIRSVLFTDAASLRAQLTAR